MGGFLIGSLSFGIERLKFGRRRRSAFRRDCRDFASPLRGAKRSTPNFQLQTPKEDTTARRHSIRFRFPSFRAGGGRWGRHTTGWWQKRQPLRIPAAVHTIGYHRRVRSRGIHRRRSRLGRPHGRAISPRQRDMDHVGLRVRRHDQRLELRWTIRSRGCHSGNRADGATRLPHAARQHPAPRFGSHHRIRRLRSSAGGRFSICRCRRQRRAGARPERNHEPQYRSNHQA